jgi:hypothetical protein
MCRKRTAVQPREPLFAECRTVEDSPAIRRVQNSTYGTNTAAPAKAAAIVKILLLFFPIGMTSPIISRQFRRNEAAWSSPIELVDRIWLAVLRKLQTQTMSPEGCLQTAGALRLAS